MTACSPVSASCRTPLARRAALPYSGNIGYWQGTDMRIAFTSIAVVAIVLLSAIAIAQLDTHGHPIALQLAMG